MLVSEMPRPCPQCGSLVPDETGFCGQCGAVVPPSTAPKPASTSAAQRPLGTMIGISAVELPPPPTAGPAPAQPAPQAPPVTAAAPLHGSRGLGTMIGMPAADLHFSPAPGASAPNAPPPAQPAVPVDPRDPHGQMKTMLGVAIPGIAPTQSSPPPADPSQASGSANRTMLGVAVPGIAPTHSSPPAAAPLPSGRPKPMAALPPIVPPPAPLALEPLPAARQPTQKKGFPLAIVAGVVGAVVVVAGVVAVVMWKAAPPVLVQPKLGPQGDDELHLTCESCPDATTVKVGAATATFANHEADVKLASPLKTGDNPLDLALDRPGVGRDEVVHAVVPISFRVKTDISTLASDAPAITVHVEAAPGSSVSIDGTVVQLDAEGKGVHAVDVTAELSGPADEGKQLEKKISYDVTSRDAQSKLTSHQGTVTAIAPIPPLRVDAPSSHAVVESGSFFVAGRTVPKGATVTANGKVLPVGDNGFFGDTFTTNDSSTKIIVRATVANMAPRLVELDVRKVDSLANEAKTFAAHASLGYDEMAANVDANVGKEIVVTGNVLESRVQNHQTVIVLDDKNGCAHGPCVTRVTHGAELALHPGDPIRVFGRVAGSAKDKQGKSVPEVEADFVLKGLDKP